MTGPAPLFVPGHRPRHRHRAAELGVELIVDLEDAVPPDDKAAARRGAVELIGAAPGHCTVRINPLDADGTGTGRADVRAVVAPGIAGVLAPKIDTPAALRRVHDALADAESAAGLPAGSVPLTALVESARGVLNAAAIADTDPGRPLRMAFGAGDLTADLGVEWAADEAGVDAARAMVPLASRAAGLARPLDSAFADLADADALRASARRGKALGYGGKPAVHPDQIDVIRDAYRPSERELEHARRVLAADRRAGGGAFALDGRMVDGPIVARARRLLGEGA